MNLKKNKQGYEAFINIVNSNEYSEFYLDTARKELLLINKLGAIMAVCSKKLTEYLIEKEIITLDN